MGRFRRAFPIFLALMMGGGALPGVVGAEIEEVVVQVKGAMICSL